MVHDVETSTDVDSLWGQLVAAKQAQDLELVARIERRMRELAGHNDDRAHAHRDQSSSANDATRVAMIRSDNEGGGF